MNRPTIEYKMKRLAVNAVVLTLVAAAASFAGLFLFTDLPLNVLSIGFGIAAVIAVIGYFILNSAADTWANETKNEVSHLAATASAFAVGNFSANLRSDSATELGQIEGALAQLSKTQKSLTKDVESLARRGDTLIDDKAYSGTYQDMAKVINSIVTSHTESINAIARAMNALANGNLAAVNLQKSEAANAYSELRRKIETMSRELQTAVTNAEKAKAEIQTAREQTEAARYEASKAKEEANEARREVSAVNSELNMLRRESNRTPMRTTGARPAVPSSPSRVSSQSDSPAAIKSVKVDAPSGSHEYDRRDYGKY
jgi:uncharacterized phage infection (PIP) family protein YhgE